MKLQRFLLPLVALLFLFTLPALQPYDDIPGPSLEDIISLRNAGSPAISPDGKHVAFTMRTTDWKNNRYDTEIWLSRDGGDPFQLTRTDDGSSSNPQWSPDGEWLSFSASRGNKTQVYALRLDGGEAQPLTHAPEGISGYAWSPDGSQIAYTMTEPQDSTLNDREEQLGAFQIEDSDYQMTHLWIVDVAPDAWPAPHELYCADDKDACSKPPEPRQLTER